MLETVLGLTVILTFLNILQLDLMGLVLLLGGKYKTENVTVQTHLVNLRHHCEGEC